MVTKKMSQTNIYHEKQLRELCALHTLNNLFQAKGYFTKSQLDEICKQLSPSEWINPHRSVLGLGNYDINVIMAALQKKSYEAIWFDKRRDPSCINTNEIIGFILNVPTGYKLSFLVLPFKRRHWIAVRKIGEQYWNLDSKLDSPLLIGDEENLLIYLKAQLQNLDKELFLIVKNEPDKGQPWFKEQPSTPTEITTDSEENR